MDNLKELLGKCVRIKTDNKGVISGIVREAWDTGVVIGNQAVYQKNMWVVTVWEDY